MLPSVISYVAAAGAFGIAVAVVLRNYRSFIHVVFAVGMALFGFEVLLIGVAAQASFAGEMLRWQRYRLLASSFLPGVWLVFSISFARANYREFLSRWKWVLAGLFVVSLSLVLLFRNILSCLNCSGRPFYGGYSPRVVRLRAVSCVSDLGCPDPTTLRRPSGMLPATPDGKSNS